MSAAPPETTLSAGHALNDKGQMQALLADWAARGWLRDLDAAFAGFLWREVPGADPLLILAAALASHQLGRGHVFLDLEATLDDPAFALSLPPEGTWDLGPALLPPLLPGALLEDVTLERWLTALDCPELVGEGEGATPLVRVGARLYLRRYWRHEREVEAAIHQRLESSTSLVPPMAALRHGLDGLFPPSDGPSPDWQKIACALAARSAFSIVTGGPGTGKTTTVVRLLALLQSLALAAPAESGRSPRPLRIRLAAPTGKAAARLNESIAGAVADLPLQGMANGEAVRAAIPVRVTTLHRLLGSRPDSRQFRHHAGNPLPIDLLVIDEASMVDLEMMAAVLAALPPAARLILLGDKDQLASVEAGAVLGGLCRRAHEGHYTPATRDWLLDACGERIDEALVDAHGQPLDQAVAMLRHSHRFSAASGIGRLAEAVNAGNSVAADALLRSGSPDLALLALEKGSEASFRALVVEGGEAHMERKGYRHYLETLRHFEPAPGAGQDAFDAWARAVLKAHGQFQLLCALRRGPWGVEGLNPRIARLLHAEGLVEATEGWYLGRPVLVTRNDYGLGLMNGDIGITLRLPGGKAGEWQLRVAFPAGDGGQGIRWILPSRLQAVETVYALTVHKSQGSEFTHAALVLPDAPSPILTRELIYTGITRARSFMTLANPGGPHILDLAVQRRALRASSL